jgi:peptide/nickel transport system permease protein
VTDLGSFGTQLKQSIMPIAVLALFQTATFVRYTRASMLENLPQDYVRTARAKGLAEFRVIGRHVVRNSLIPVVTLIALTAPTVFSGALITEQIFRVPGIGALLITSIQNNDIPVIMAITVTFSFLIVLMNIVADITYGVLDPRIRYD